MVLVRLYLRNLPNPARWLQKGDVATATKESKANKASVLLRCLHMANLDVRS